MGTYTGTTTNTVTMERIDLILRQIRVLMEGLSDWSGEHIEKLLVATSRQYVVGLKFTVEDNFSVYGRAVISIDWKSYSLKVSQNGTKTTIRSKYEASLPETEELVSSMQEISRSTGIKISTYITTVGKEVYQIMPFLHPAALDEYEESDSFGFSNREISEVDMRIGSGRKTSGTKKVSITLDKKRRHIRRLDVIVRVAVIDSSGRKLKEYTSQQNDIIYRKVDFSVEYRDPYTLVEIRVINCKNLDLLDLRIEDLKSRRNLRASTIEMIMEVRKHPTAHSR